MNALQKMEVLREVYADEAELGLIVEKLLDITLSRRRRCVRRYERELREFEKRYNMKSATFYQRFEAGELGDAMDFFEWAGLYELRRALMEKIRRLEVVT
ncbi:MAG TPA: hypothetical protein G4N98_08770 [Thermoflexia bacterium]|nr:hypothetical protein [Thermoflexia bacterium]